MLDLPGSTLVNNSWWKFFNLSAKTWAQNASGARRCSACLGPLSQAPFKLSVPVVLFIFSLHCVGFLLETCRSRSQRHRCATLTFQANALSPQHRNESSGPTRKALKNNWYLYDNERVRNLIFFFFLTYIYKSPIGKS